MTASDLVSALVPVVEAFEVLGVRYFIGGSLASSVHGVPRTSIDADVVTELGPEHVAAFVARLQASYYVDEDRVRAAVHAWRSFNVIHLETVFKIDVFVSRARPFDQQAFDRARPAAVEEAARPFPVSSPEDTILAKLEWFRAGGETSERQWADCIGMLRTAGTGLDHGYLQRWAAALRISDLLERADREARAG